MTSQSFGVALTIGSAGLAFWILWRLGRFGPRSVVWAIVHTILALVALRLIPVVFARLGESGLPGVIYIEIFVIALPALVYAWLSGGWLARAAFGLLRP